MSTYKEIAYMVLDELKSASDDRYYEIEHVVYLLDNYRSLILKQRYGDVRKNIADINYQTIDINLIQVPAVAGEISEGGTFLKSVEKIPPIIGFNGTPLVTKVTSTDNWSGDFAYVNRDRFSSVGYNKWLYNCVYCALGPDDYIYSKSANPLYLLLKTARVNTILESPKDAFIQSIDTPTYLDMQYPLEASLIPVIIDMTLKELLGALYRPQDKDNNASDDISDIQVKQS